MKYFIPKTKAMISSWIAHFIFGCVISSNWCATHICFVTFYTSPLPANQIKLLENGNERILLKMTYRWQIKWTNSVFYYMFSLITFIHRHRNCPRSTIQNCNILQSTFFLLNISLSNLRFWKIANFYIFYMEDYVVYFIFVSFNCVIMLYSWYPNSSYHYVNC